MRTITALAAALSLSFTVADAKPRARKPKTDTAWVKACIHERTGPDAGIPVGEARTICLAEQPEDDIEATKQALTLARLNAKVAKAKARAAKALESCGQAITDRCVEYADPVKGADCDTDAGLHAEYELVCLGIAPSK
jgi:hypothetical protein